MIEHIRTKIPPEVVSLRLFGSFGRGDADSDSDLDILAIAKSALGAKSKGRVQEAVEGLFRRPVNISWYGASRIADMYSSGHLFAWHLFRESKSIVATSKVDFLANLQSPSPYVEAEEDVTSLIGIMRTIPDSLEISPRNSIYEAGLLFICMRNIALSLSWYTKEGLDFSRYSPFKVSDSLGLKLEIERADFDLLVRSRLASQRGIIAQEISTKHLMAIYKLAINWALESREFLSRRIA